MKGSIRPLVHRLAAVLLLCAGCGQASTSGYVCDQVDQDSECFDYADSGWSRELVVAVCGEGTVAASPCPADARLGTCTVAVLGQKVSFYSRGGDPYSAQRAQSVCTGLGGAFTPG